MNGWCCFTYSAFLAGECNYFCHCRNRSPEKKFGFTFF